MRLFNFISCLVLVFTMVSATGHSIDNVQVNDQVNDQEDRAANFYGDNDPWPWGAECPFPWEGISGWWQIEPSSSVRYLHFKTVSELASGAHIFEISMYDEGLNIVSMGKGLASRDMKIARAAMTSMDSDGPQENYWAMIRAFIDGEDSQCGEAQMVRALTVRSLDGDVKADDGQHYLLRKLNFQESPSSPNGSEKCRRRSKP